MLHLKVVRPFLLIAGLSIGANLVPASLAQKPTARPAKHLLPKSHPLSPLYARLALLYVQEIEDMGSLSAELIPVDGRYDSPFDMRQNSFDQEMERVEQFDLQTSGDQSLDNMVTTGALLLVIHKRAISNLDVSPNKPDRYGNRWRSCMSDIRRAIDARSYTSDGFCHLDPEPKDSDVVATP